MTEPSDEELERAARIRRLRSGGATSESYRRRRHREASRPVPASATGETGGTAGGEGAAEETDVEGAAARADDAGETAEEADVEGELDADAVELVDPDEAEARDDLVVVSLPEDAPDDVDVVAVPASEGLRRELASVGEALHMRYGFAFKTELDPALHVRPLALSLGLRELDEMDPEAVRELLEEVDVVDAPDHSSGDGPS